MRKKVTLIVFILFLLFGLVIWKKGSLNQELLAGDGPDVILKNRPISQQFVGNDYSLKSITFEVAAKEMSDTDTLHIYFLKNSNEISEENILEETVLSGEQIQEIITLNYDNIIMKYGHDYYIAFSLDNYYEGESLTLKGSQGGMGGIYEEDVPYGMSLAYSATYFTHSTNLLLLWKIILLYFCFSISAMYIATALKKNLRFWEALILSTVITLFSLYILALADLIEYAVYIIYILCACPMLCALFCAIKKEKKNGINLFADLIENNMTQIAVWVVLMILWYLHDRGMYLHIGDECNHWALAVKNMYVHDKMYINSDSTVYNYRYPPVYSLIQYFFLSIAQRYSIAGMHLAKHFLETSCILYVLSLKKEISVKKVYYVFSIFIVIGIPAIFYQNVDRWYNGLQADITLGIVFGAFLVACNRYLEEKDKSIWLTFALAFILVLVKDNGMILLVAALLSYALLLFVQKDVTQKRKNAKAIILSFLGGGIARFSWEIYYNNHIILLPNVNATSTAQVANVSPSRLIAYLTGKGEPYQYEIIGKHILKLFFQDEYRINILSCSYVIMILGAIGLLCCQKYIVDGQNTNTALKKRNDREKVIITALVSVFCAIGYHVVYTFTMSEGEALIFASETRYLGSALLGIYIYIFGSYTTILNCEKIVFEKLQKYLVVLCVILVIFTNCFSVFTSRIVEKKAERKDIIKGEVLREMVREDDNILFISLNDLTYGMVYKVQVTPAKIFDIGMPRIEGSGESCNDQTTYVRMKEMLQDYDWVYLDKIDDLFKEEYGSLFEEDSAICDSTLYKVNKNHKDVNLINYGTITLSNAQMLMCE